MEEPKARLWSVARTKKGSTKVYPIRLKFPTELTEAEVRGWIMNRVRMGDHDFDRFEEFDIWESPEA